MTQVEAPALYVPIPAPPIRPHRFGVESVVTFEPLGEHESLGITWASDACAAVGLTEDRCIDVAEPGLTAAGHCAIPQFKPFVVFHLADDSLPTSATDQDRVRRATDRFVGGEQYAVELGLVTQLAAAVPSPVNMVTTYPSGGNYPLLTLAYVENANAAATQGDGTIVMSAFAATILSDHLRNDAGVLRTVRGTPVVVTAQLGTADITIYGTAPLVGRRGPITNNGVQYDQEVNDESVLVQRTYVIGYDCNPVGATYDLSAGI